jgi:hypothetical protein
MSPLSARSRERLGDGDGLLAGHRVDDGGVSTGRAVATSAISAWGLSMRAGGGEDLRRLGLMGTRAPDDVDDRRPAEP